MSDEKEIEYYPYPVPSRFKTEQDFRNGLIEFNEIIFYYPTPLKLFIY